MLRPEDEALARYLEEEVAARALWEFAGGKGTPPPRFATLLAAFPPPLPGVKSPLASIVAGAYDEPLRALLEGARAGTIAPAGMHAVAVFAPTLAALPGLAARPLGVELEVAAVLALARLVERPSYLRARALQAAGEDLPRVNVDEILTDLPRGALRTLGQRALTGARERTPNARRALEALYEIQRVERGPLGAAAGVAAAAALEEAIAAPAEAIAEAKAREDGPLAAEGLLTLVAVWKWGGYPLLVETQALEMADHFLWAWTKGESAEERALKQRVLVGLRPLVEHLAARVEADEAEHFAWSALTAQSLVFLSDLDAPLAERRALAERAVALCKTHRNARSRLAWHRAEQANGLLAEGTPSALAEADRLLKDGERLFPQSPAIRSARARWEARR